MEPSSESLAPRSHTPRRIILASTSPYRRQLLERLHIPFDTVDPIVDEAPLQRSGLSATDLTRALAEAKAHAVGKMRRDDLIIGCDQCVALDGLLLGKPGSLDAAVEQLMLLSGRTHQLVTALCLLDAHTQLCATTVDVVEMTLRPLTAQQIRRYVEIDRPIDCAGSFRIESLGVALFEHVLCEDPTAIVGLPLMRLVSMLQDAGVDVFEAASGK